MPLAAVTVTSQDCCQCPIGLNGAARIESKSNESYTSSSTSPITALQHSTAWGSTAQHARLVVSSDALGLVGVLNVLLSGTGTTMPGRCTAAAGCGVHAHAAAIVCSPTQLLPHSHVVATNDLQAQVSHLDAGLHSHANIHAATVRHCLFCYSS